jgi:hypothetical protein
VLGDVHPADGWSAADLVALAKDEIDVDRLAEPVIDVMIDITPT